MKTVKFDREKFFSEFAKVAKDFDKREDAMVRIILAAAFDERTPQDLRYELIERALHQYKLSCSFTSLLGFTQDLLAIDFEEKNALQKARGIVSAIAGYAINIAEKMDKHGRLVCASVEAAQTIAKEQEAARSVSDSPSPRL